MLELASRAGDAAGNAPVNQQLSIWSWQAPPWFAPGSPFAWFGHVSGRDYHAPFAGRAAPSGGGGAATVQNVANAAHMGIGSGPAFQPFREYAA